LTEAERSLSTGGKGSGAALEVIGQAFELFRARAGTEPGSPAQPADRREASSLGNLARRLADLDESVAAGEPARIQSALEKMKEALDIAGWEDSAHASGVRRRIDVKVPK
jgi:hypothetical protein